MICLWYATWPLLHEQKSWSPDTAADYSKAKNEKRSAIVVAFESTFRCPDSGGSPQWYPSLHFLVNIDCFLCIGNLYVREQCWLNKEVIIWLVLYICGRFTSPSKDFLLLESLCSFLHTLNISAVTDSEACHYEEAFYHSLAISYIIVFHGRISFANIPRYSEEVYCHVSIIIPFRPVLLYLPWKFGIPFFLKYESNGSRWTR